MADKGFDIKVLIPTDDGFTISENEIDKAKYYLSYNLSNRSYQLAGKLKSAEVIQTNSNNLDDLNSLILKENIDFIIHDDANANISCKFLKPKLKIISEILNKIIDQIDQKKELI